MKRRGRRVAILLILSAMPLVLALPARSSSPSGGSETITVDAGQTTPGTMQLVPGVTYHAVVSGSIRVDYASPAAYEIHDAYYCYETNWPGGESPGKCLGNKPADEYVALRAHYGQGSSSCAAAYACDVGLGASKGKPLAYQASTHTYEQDFEVSQPGTVKVSADVICPPGDTAEKCGSGSFSVTISTVGCSRPPGSAHAAAACQQQLPFQFRVDGFPRSDEKELPHDLVTVAVHTVNTKLVESGGVDVGMGEVKMTTTYLEPSLRTVEKHITFKLDDLSADGYAAPSERRVIVDGKVVSSTDPHCPAQNTVQFDLRVHKFGGSLSFGTAPGTKKPCLFTRRNQTIVWYDDRNTPPSDRHLKSAKIGKWEPLA